MAKVSVCTIYAHRKLHLQNLVTGLTESDTPPAQLVIVCMNDRLPQLPETSFAIATATINTSNSSLPLAAARNKAAQLATGDQLIFLDVDCICDRHLISTFNYHLEQEDALYSGSVRYLTNNWQQQDWNFTSLHQQSSPHQLQGSEVTDNDKIVHPYELFWSLCFGIRKKTFARIHGFDPEYTGYGGEDTDFAFTARSHNIPLYKISALAYHQFHASYAPPLNHLAEIVDNAQVFYRKWDIMPMEKWLRQFADLGYITMENNQLKIIKLPSEMEISACLKSA
ncbi:MAG: glycosyltransferase family 2 protein [Cyanobacteria bacterium P01_A01_bin.83]